MSQPLLYNRSQPQLRSRAPLGLPNMLGIRSLRRQDGPRLRQMMFELATCERLAREVAPP